MSVEQAEMLEVRRKRALYRAAHRGTKEMDILLSKYAKACVGDMNAAALCEFEALLEMPDPQLQRWLVSLEAPGDEDVPSLIGLVRAFHGLEA